MKICSVEGNIGAGKTTLLQDFRVELGDIGASVPILSDSAIANSTDAPQLLRNFYENPSKYCLELNERIIKYGFESLWKIPPGADKGVLWDGSLLATRNVFLPSVTKRNILDAGDGKDLIQTIDDFLEKESIEIIPIWLPKTPETCLKRIKQRARSGAEHITLDLLKRHDELYRQWLGGGFLTRLLNRKDLVLRELNVRELLRIVG